MRRPAFVLALVGVVLTAVLAAAPVLADIYLTFYRVVPSPTAVTLEWGTKDEKNLLGFDVQAKTAADPESAYHTIGFVKAHGGPGTPALYSFAATQVASGTPYCFRLKELTQDGAPGDVFEACGYGLDITPTPTYAPVVSMPAATQPTAAPTAPAETATVLPAAAPPTPVGGQPVQPAAPPAEVTPAPVQPAPVNPSSPLPTPEAAQPAPPQPPAPVEPAPALNQPPSPQPALPVQSADGSQPVSPLAAPVEAAPGALAAQPVDGAGNQVPGAQPAAVMPTSAAAQYVVVTATPTQLAAVFGAVLTPLPTVTPTPNAYQLVGLLEPTAQNVMAMLLCLTFSGATTIGILGLLASVMYMRARSSQREFYDRYSDRHRR